MSDLRTLATTYLDGWRTGDFGAVAATLADDVTFRGPLGAADGIEDCLAGLSRMAPSITDIVIACQAVDGDENRGNVITWYELRTVDAPPIPTANWSQVVDGRITAIRAAFDPRPLTGG